MTKNLVALFISSLILLTQCVSPAYECPECLCFSVSYLDSSQQAIEISNLPFNTIKLVEVDTVVFNKNTSSGFPYLLYVYPLADQSTFVFSYPSNPNDTIILQHHFSVENDHKCGDYYFKNTGYRLFKCTFSHYELIASKNDSTICPSDIKIYF